MVSLNSQLFSLRQFSVVPIEQKQTPYNLSITTFLEPILFIANSFALKTEITSETIMLRLLQTGMRPLKMMTPSIWTILTDS